MKSARSGRPEDFEFQEEDHLIERGKMGHSEIEKNESFHFTIDFTFIVQTPVTQMILLLNYKTHHYIPNQLKLHKIQNPKMSLPKNIVRRNLLHVHTMVLQDFTLYGFRTTSATEP